MRHQHGAGCERAGKGATIMHEAACKHFFIAWQCSQGFSSPHARDTAIRTLKAWQEVVVVKGAAPAAAVVPLMRR